MREMFVLLVHRLILHMTLSDVAKYRLINQQLVNTKLANITDVVEWFAAIQAQEYAQTKFGSGITAKNTAPYSCT